MKNQLEEWEVLAGLALDDYKVFSRLIGSDDLPLPPICFHGQQAVEKVSVESLEKLNPFAVKQRYDLLPELHLTRVEAKEIVDKIINWCQKQLHD